MTAVRSLVRTSVGVLLAGTLLLCLMDVSARDITFPNMWPFLNRKSGDTGIRDEDGKRRYELKVRQRPINGLVSITYTVDGQAADHAQLHGDTWRRQVWAHSVVLIAEQESRISILDCWILDPLTGDQLDHDTLLQQSGEVDCIAGG
mgnify:CR=1 FL=1